MQASNPINYLEAGKDLMASFEAVMGVITERGLDTALYHLVLLRASQINQCGFCVKMHTREAREDGETNDRLDQLIIWRHSNAFTEKEKAAFAWTEALTELDDESRLPGLRAQLRQYFSEEEIATLTALVAMINVWNRIQVSNH